MSSLFLEKSLRESGGVHQQLGHSLSCLCAQRNYHISFCKSLTLSNLSLVEAQLAQLAHKLVDLASSSSSTSWALLCERLE